MKYTKQDLKTAKGIFDASVEDGKLDEPKLLSLVSGLRKLNPRNAKSILSALIKQVSNFYKKQTLVVESIEEVPQKYLDEISKKYEQKNSRPLKLEFKRNPSLLAGLKITLGDTVWDYSVINTLDYFKETTRG